MKTQPCINSYEVMTVSTAMIEMTEICRKIKKSPMVYNYIIIEETRVSIPMIICGIYLGMRVESWV